MSVKAMSIEDLYIYAKIDGLEHFLIDKRLIFSKRDNDEV